MLVASEESILDKLDFFPCYFLKNHVFPTEQADMDELKRRITQEIQLIDVPTLRKAGGTTQQSKKLPRSVGILVRQIVSGKKRRRGEGESEKIEENEKRKERKGQRKIEKRNTVNSLVSL